MKKVKLQPKCSNLGTRGMIEVILAKLSDQGGGIPLANYAFKGEVRRFFFIGSKFLLALN